MTPFDNDRLEQNCATWTRRLGKVPEGCKPQVLEAVPTSHTIRNRNFRDVGRKRHAHERIFFEDRALLSGSMPTAADKAAGLTDHVFAYLGAHDPWKTRGYFPAIGVFIDADLELNDSYDISACIRNPDSPQLGSFEVTEAETIVSCRCSRRLAGVQICQLHSCDVEHFLGAADSVGDVEYMTKRWQWMHQYNYRRRVDIAGIAAVLCPYGYTKMSNGGTFPSGLLSDEDAKRIKREWPGIAVIPYEYSKPTAFPDFYRASALALRMKIERGFFPRVVMRDSKAQ